MALEKAGIGILKKGLLVRNLDMLRRLATYEISGGIYGG